MADQDLKDYEAQQAGAKPAPTYGAEEVRELAPTDPRKSTP